MRLPTLLKVLILACATSASASASASADPAPAPAPAETWTATWASSQQVADSANALPAKDLKDITIREVVHLSIGGDRVRIRFSNAFGTTPLHLGAAHIGRPTGLGPGEILPATDRPLTFGGRPDVVIPEGADYWSDPVDLAVPALSSLTVSLYIPDTPAQETSHPGAHATSYYARGNQTQAADLTGATSVEHWYWLSGVEEVSAGPAHAIVALGDSITDGHAATLNGDDRWPDDLARRLRAEPGQGEISVLNEGVGGNRLLQDGIGPNALARFDRDVLSQAGVTTVILLEGVNDLGMLTRLHAVSRSEHAAAVEALLAGYQQLIARAHAHGLRILGATVLPYTGSGYYHPDKADEADRQAVNIWIRTPGHFNGVIDFDAALRDQTDPSKLQMRYDSGDHLHPSPAGYRAMSDAVPLALIR